MKSFAVSQEGLPVLLAQFFAMLDEMRAKSRKVVDHFLVIGYQEFANVCDSLGAANTSHNQPTENEVLATSGLADAASTR